MRAQCARRARPWAEDPVDRAIVALFIFTLHQAREPVWAAAQIEQLQSRSRFTNWIWSPAENDPMEQDNTAVLMGGRVASTMDVYLVCWSGK